MRMRWRRCRSGIAALAAVVAACSSGGSDPEPAAARANNTAPLIAGTPVRTIAAGSTYSFIPTAGDNDGDPLIFGIDGKPGWATFDTGTGQLSGTPAMSDAGLYRGIVVWVSDSRSTSALTAFDLTVTAPSATNRDPQIDGVPPASIVAGSTYTFTPVASDPDATPLTFTIRNRPAWATFDAATGRLTGTPQIGNVGTFADIGIAVTDGQATAALPAFSIVVTAPPINRPPVISGTPLTAVEGGRLYDFTPTASDLDAGDSLTFAVQNKPVWAAFDAQSGRLFGTPAATPGTFANVIITVSDGQASASLPSFTINVTTPTANRAPVINGTPETSALQGTQYSFQPTASDADNDPLTFAIANLPSWGTFNTSTGLLRGTPGAVDVATFNNVVISVSDGKQSVSLPAFAITVASSNTPPTISGTPATTAIVGLPYSFQPTAGDANAGTALTFSIQNKPVWATFTPANGLLQGTPGAAHRATYSNIAISVSDGQETTALPAFAITVTNTPPQISGAPAPSVVVGSTYTFTPVASDPDGTPLTFTIQNRPLWASFDSATGRLQGAPLSGNAGSYPDIRIAVTDGVDTAQLTPFEVVVIPANSPPVISGAPATFVQAGSPYAFVPTASDPDLNPLTFSIANLPPWASFNSSTGALTSLAGRPGPGDVGTTNGVVISVSDGSLGAALAAFSITVNAPSNHAPTISGTPATNALQGALYSFQATAADLDGDALTFSIANKPAWLTFSAGATTATLQGTPGAGDVGPHNNIVISVSDAKGSISLAPFSIVVTSTNTPPTISGTPASTAIIGVPYSFQPIYGDVNGTPLTFAVQNQPPWANFSTSTGALNGTPGVAHRTTYSNIVISVSDGQDVTSLPAFAITVTNTVPQITGTPAGSVEAGSSYGFTPFATDPDGQLLTFTIQNRPPWAAFDPTTGRLAGMPLTGNAGTSANIRIGVTDGVDTQELPPFSIVVTVPNSPPQISGVPVASVEAGSPYVFVPTASDPDLNPLTFSIANLPPWASFNSSTGALTSLAGRPALGDVGTTSGIAISVTDGSLSALLPAFAIEVIAPTSNRAPVINGTPETSALQGTQYSFQPTASDADNDPLTFTIANLPSWATFNTSTGLLRGTPGAVDIATFDNVVISVSDGKQSVSLPAFAITVASSNTPPTISGTPAATAIINVPYSFTPTAVDANAGTTLTFTIQNEPPWASFSTSTGALTGTPGVAHRTTYSNIVISVSDGQDITALPAFAITVTNTVPQISGTPAPSVVVGSTYTFTPVASDPDGTPLTFTIQNRPLWASFDSATGRLQGTPLSGNAGPHSDIRIAVTDGVDAAQLAPFSVEVTVPNSPPVISGAPMTSVEAGSPYAFVPTASDPDGNPLTFSITSLPSWASFNSSTGALTSLAGRPGPGDVGTTNGIVISVSDGSLSASLPAFAIIVTASPNRAPTIAGTPATNALQGTLYTFQPTAADLDGDALTFSIANAPVWAAFNTSTGLLQGTPGAAHIGTHANIVISVSDGTDSASLAAFAIAVASSNTPPTISGTPATFVNVGSSYAFAPVANDANPGTTLTFAIQNPPSWANFSTTTGALNGTPSAAHAGVYANIVISVSDGQDTAAFAPFEITVNRVPQISGIPATQVTQGELYVFAPGASDPDANPLTFTIQNRPSWASFDPGTGVLQGTPGPVGTTSNIVIGVSDGLASATLPAFSITVEGANNPPVISGTPLTTAPAGSAYVFTPNASDTDAGTTLTFSIANMPPWASFSTGTGQLTGTPATANTGVYPNITISVTDGQATASLGPFAITVTNATPVIGGTPLTTVAAGAAYSFTPTASDANAGTALTFSIANKPAWAGFNSSTGQLSGTPATANTGIYPNVTISVTDGLATASLAAFQIEVTNAAPVINGTPPTSATAGTLYTFTPTASDANASTTLTFSIVNKPAWATFDMNTGQLQGTPAAADAGVTFSGIVISVADGRATTSLPSFNIAVQNRPPTISGTPPPQVTEGTPYSFQPTASDPDGNPLTFSIANLPPWASFSAATGALTSLAGRPALGDVGTTNGIVITVSDGKGGSAALGPFSITVQGLSTGSALLTWVPPTQNTDGTPLTNLVGYKVYWGTALGNYPNSELVDGAVSSYLVQNLVPNTYYFVITARTAAGVESQFSNVASKTIP